MKENDLEKVTQEIANNQLLYYLYDIEHKKLILWQKSSGLSKFELALIQPTYGPPTQVCAAKSPIQWNSIEMDSSNIFKIFKNELENTIYCISILNYLGLHHEIKRYSPDKQTWSSIGTKISGQIFDLSFCDNEIYVSVLLPNEEFPHQILKLKNKKWEKVAHFNGNIISIQSFKDELYVLGNFTKTNDSTMSVLVIINKNSVRSFYNTRTRTLSFDNIRASKTLLFLLSRGGIYKFKNDTLKLLNNIKYYDYLNNFTIDVLDDSLYIWSIKVPGYYKYYENKFETVELNTMIDGLGYPYGTPNFSNSKILNERIVSSGTFKASTFRPQINENTILVDCEENHSKHWYGEGLIYQFKNTFYPILDKGVVSDFVLFNNRIYILKDDGSMSYAEIDKIEKEIVELRERGGLTKE